MTNKGQWVSCGNHIVCSVCGEWAITTTDEDGKEIDILSNFCPNCGVDMRYEPYFPTGMKLNGTVYDELTESKAITRVGSVDLRRETE